MKHVFLAVAFLLAVGSIAAGGPQASLLNFTSSGSQNLLSNDCLTDAAADLTITQRLDSAGMTGWSRVAQMLKVTVDDATDLEVSVTCTRSLDGTAYGAPPSLSVSAGVATVTPLVFHKTFTQSTTSYQTIDVDVFGYRYLKCVYAPVGTADAGDKIWVQWTAAASK
jgi:hypothetical protein